MKKKSSDNNLPEATILERVVFIYGEIDTRARSGHSWAEDVADFYLNAHPNFLEAEAGLEVASEPFDGEEWLDSYWN